MSVCVSPYCMELYFIYIKKLRVAFAGNMSGIRVNLMKFVLGIGPSGQALTLRNAP